MAWVDTVVAGTPEPRYGHGAVTAEGRIYVFGGTNGSGILLEQRHRISLAFEGAVHILRGSGGTGTYSCIVGGAECRSVSFEIIVVLL